MQVKGVSQAGISGRRQARPYQLSSRNRRILNEPRTEVACISRVSGYPGQCKNIGKRRTIRSGRSRIRDHIGQGPRLLAGDTTWLSLLPGETFAAWLRLSL